MTTADDRTGTHASLPRQLAGLGIFLLLCYGSALLGQIATGPNIPTWYAGLTKPSLNPPNWIFPVVWTTLYTIMALAAWLVWREDRAPGRAIALTAFFVQLALNIAWSWAFFGAHSPLAGLIVILALLAAIATTAVLFARVSRPAAWLMVPYLAWVAFATFLNASILALN